MKSTTEILYDIDYYLHRSSKKSFRTIFLTIIVSLFMFESLTNVSSLMSSDRESHTLLGIFCFAFFIGFGLTTFIYVLRIALNAASFYMIKSQLKRDEKLGHANYVGALLLTNAYSQIIRYFFNLELVKLINLTDGSIKVKYAILTLPLSHSRPSMGRLITKGIFSFYLPEESLQNYSSDRAA